MSRFVVSGYHYYSIGSANKQLRAAMHHWGWGRKKIFVLGCGVGGWFLEFWQKGTTMLYWQLFFFHANTMLD